MPGIFFRELTPIEVDTIRVALEALVKLDPASLDLLSARQTANVMAILSDDDTARLSESLAGASTVTLSGPIV